MHRELLGATVEFGEGAVPTAVTFLSDFSALRINNLRENHSDETVVGILNGVSLRISADDMLLTPNEVNRGCYAIVTREDATFATTACRRLRTDPRVSHLLFSPITVPGPQNPYLDAVNYREVRCCWDRPTRPVTLHYVRAHPPFDVLEKLLLNVYTVLGSGAQQPSLHDRQNHCALCDDRHWTITIGGVPAAATRMDIIRDFAEQDWPIGIELGELSYPDDFAAQFMRICSLLSAFGPLETCRVLDEPVRRRTVIIRAIFMDES